MPLALPGISASQLALALPAAPAAGAQKLNPQFHAILCQCKVKSEHIAALGDADCDSAAVFGHIAKTEEKFYVYIKRILNADPDAKGEDAVPAARLFMAWEVCRKRTEGRRQLSGL